jgi:hypothetical protein
MRERTYRPVALALSITSVGLGITFWQHDEASGSGGTRSLPSRALARSVSLGPEGVPIPAAPALAGPGEPAVGVRVDGISCGAIEQLAFHVQTASELEGLVADLLARRGEDVPARAELV